MNAHAHLFLVATALREVPAADATGETPSACNLLQSLPDGLETRSYFDCHAVRMHRFSVAMGAHERDLQLRLELFRCDAVQVPAGWTADSSTIISHCQPL
jgi:hypothetical protein